MTNFTAQHARLAVRASDAEREQTVALLQRSFADGRLTQAELEERAGAAYAARTRAQLLDLTADLPAAEQSEQQPSRPGMVLDTRLLGILLCVCPPAGVATGCYLSAEPLRCFTGLVLPCAAHFPVRGSQRPLTERPGSGPGDSAGDPGRLRQQQCEFAS